jgi:CRISPR-associated protein Cmr1
VTADANVPERWPTVEPRPRAVRGGPRSSAFSVTVEVVTPILGGSSRTREVDVVDVIRPATVRGHLRFWWRVLRGHELQWASPEDLHEAEGRVWGRAATDAGGRSAVEVRIDLIGTPGAIDDSDVQPTGTAGAYALWPARAEKRVGTPAAPRRRRGTRFRLTVTGPADREAEARDAVRAWLLFGGYGSRTRRGLGSLDLTGDIAGWLPANATRQAITEVFGRDVFAAPGRPAVDTPWLAGAALQAGEATRDPEVAWTTALNWLQEFRQGTVGDPGDRAREPGPGSNRRPSISNWPEADKVRHLTGKTSAHQPRHNAAPAWPRAGFGLPIEGQFQTRARDDNKDDQKLDEPGRFKLSWSPSRDHPVASRLASPLVVKALPLANGTFVPCALWLHRAYPEGQVVLQGHPESGAPFDRLVAPGDIPRFRALEGEDARLRSAFLDWLRVRHGTMTVAP